MREVAALAMQIAIRDYTEEVRLLTTLHHSFGIDIVR
jgi:hypothetical protein